MSAHAGDQRLGPYRLGEQLGEGGMGVVYLASDPAGQLVAVKVLRQGVPAEATARRRLAREVETMRRVHSPHVAQVVDADVEGSPPYIVTRYVAGRTLEDVVSADGPLTGLALAKLANGLAAALVAVHQAGVVHRDLKPGNVLLVDGEPVVIDFGIAQAPDSTRLTMTGMFMGTPGYLAPEVIEGHPSGQAADVHSFGATMAYAATGRPPFGTGQYETIFYRIVHGQPELDAMPVPLLPIVASTLAKDPSRRPAATEVAELVSGLAAETLVPGPAGAAVGTDREQAPADSGAVTRTAQDVLAAAAGGQPVPAAPAAWPGTRPMAVPAAKDDFADVLTPVRYAEPDGGGAAGALARPADLSLSGLPSASAMPGQFASGQAWPSVAVPGQGSLVLPAGGSGPASRAGTGGGRTFATVPMVAATLVGLVAISVLVPVAGAVAALVALALLRATDLTTGRLVRRRNQQGPRRSDAVSAAAFYPWAVVRSALRFVLVAPLALLCAAAAATLAVLVAGSPSLPKACGYAVGALVACYCIGPGSRACRRPLSRCYGRITRSAPAAVLGSIALAAVAAAAVVAAVTLTPGYWPAVHLGNQLQTASTTHPGLGHLTADVADAGRRLARWLSQRL